MPKQKAPRREGYKKRPFSCSGLHVTYTIFSPGIISSQLSFPEGCCGQNKLWDRALVSWTVCCPWQHLALTVPCMGIDFKLQTTPRAAGNEEVGYHRPAGFLCVCHQSCPLDNTSIITLQQVLLNCKLSYTPYPRPRTLLITLIYNTRCWKSARSSGQASGSNKGMCCLSNLPKCADLRADELQKLKEPSAPLISTYVLNLLIYSLCVMSPSCLKHLRYIFSITVLGRQP